MLGKFKSTLILVFVTAIAIITTSVATAQSNYLNTGKQYYDRGQYWEAIELWQQVIERDNEIENKIAGYNYQAIAYQDIGEWEKSAKVIDSAFDLLEINNNSFLYAQVLNTKGSGEYKTGEAESAIQTWQQAEAIYRDLNEVKLVLRSQINQAQAFRTLGFYRRAKTTLERASNELNDLPDSFLKVKAGQSLGITLRSMGDLAQSQQVLNRSLNIARQINAPIESIQLSLANTAKAREDYQTAQTIYQQVRVSTRDLQTKIDASLNLLDLLTITQQTDVARELAIALASDIDGLPLSLGKIYAGVNLASKAMALGDKSYSREIKNILTSAREQAEKLNSERAKAYTVGELGHYYEQQQQWQEASKFTQEAILLAQNARATDIAANWYWQQGRILKARGETDKAIASYEQGVDTLQSLRRDLVAIDSDVRFDYRDRVEPVYRQYVQLLLTEVDNLPPQTQQEHLQKSRKAIEALQLAELENYFREACVVYQPKEIESIDPTAAVIYPILLEDRLEVILSLPNEPLQHYGNSLISQAREQIFRDINQTLNPVFLSEEVIPPARQLYDWLIRPGKVSLQQQNIKTIVFVLDDLLRSIPMSVLYDGENYLVEQYNIALTPGLQLLTSTNNATKYKTLTGGLTAARQGFPPLPKVESELVQINSLVPSEILIDDRFTRSNFQTQIERESFSTVHLATHGQFSSNAEDTFLLTWGDKINVKDIGNLVQNKGENPIELLVLSACETAAGDRRAALGIAGVAVRSGARSTVATLWAVRDDSTALLMSEFYRRLVQPGSTKAEALRQAQLSLIDNPKYNHPYYWSSFVLIGNWQ